MALFDLGGVDVALERVLDMERQLILGGKLDALPRISAEKDRLLSRLKQSTDDLVVLNRLKKKADRNQELLQAVARGIRSVSQRLEAMKTRKTQLNTYTQGGVRANLMPPRSSFEKRA